MATRAEQVAVLNETAMGDRDQWDAHGVFMFEMAREADDRIAELEARLAEVAHAYDVTFKRRTELELAILPFVEFAAHAVDVEQCVWATGVHREPISTWLGPSDFAAVAKLKA